MENRDTKENEKLRKRKKRVVIQKRYVNESAVLWLRILRIEISDDFVQNGILQLQWLFEMVSFEVNNELSMASQLGHNGCLMRALETTNQCSFFQ